MKYQRSTTGIFFLLICWILLISTATADDVKYSKTQICGHLKKNEDQFNAYIKNRRVCCMCGPGQKWVGDCNSNDPTSTICEACEEGEYMHYGPHKRPECFTQLVTHCVQPKILQTSITEKARCVCPAGMKEVSHRCVEIKATTVTRPKISTTDEVRTTLKTTVPETTKPSTNATSLHPSDAVASIAPLITKEIFKPFPTPTGTPDTDDFSFFNPTTPSNDVSKNLDTGNGLRTTAGIAIGSVVALVCICIIVLVYKKYRNTSTDRNDAEKGAASNDSTPMMSRVILVKQSPRNNRGSFLCFKTQEQSEAPIREGRLNSQEVVDETISEDEPELQPMITKQGAQRSQRSDCVRSLLLCNTEQNELPNKAGPMIANPLGLAERREDSQVPAPHPVEVDNERKERDKKFALEYATKIGNRIARNDIKPLFRAFYEEDRDTEIGEVFDRENSNGQKEIIYQLMRQATQYLGFKLTPKYILDSLGEMKDCPQVLIDIYEEEMQEPYMQGG